MKPILSYIIISLMIFLLPLHAEISVDAVNSETIGLYEKYEMDVSWEGMDYDNPYDPEEIDLSATFTSPTGIEWRVFGFYDNYLDADVWKVRFSPNEAGQWQVVVHKSDAAGEDESAVQTFTAIASEHNGWIRPSTVNPRYFEHDDGTAFYPVGMYTPWRNTVAKFDQLEAYGGNFFGIWNITYGGMTNGYGLIEEELGRYNQTKCGKLDTLLIVAEARGLKCMYCFWPHDLFSNTVWAHQWHQNPYRDICDVEDVYSDSLCWEYQKKQYRYLIARFAHSRSLGLWEMMNEINGTDGFDAGRHDEALAWVNQVHTYFKENDPYGHPTTASRSGGYNEYWPEMYAFMDVPNIHVYETQGWPQAYQANALRSSLNNYAFGALRMWQDFEKPNLFGEAGYDWVNVDLYSPDYTAMYHNALWAGLTNGLAGTPVWWTFTDPTTADERQQMAAFRDVVSGLDFIHLSQKHFESITSGYDLYIMHNDSSGFGWIRDADGWDAAGLQADLDNVIDPSIGAVSVHYVNPWTADPLFARISPQIEGKIRVKIPDFDKPLSDVFFTFEPAEGGTVPFRLELSADIYETWNNDTLQIPLTCYVFDERGRFCNEASVQVQFSVEGEGGLYRDGAVAVVNCAAQNSFLVPAIPGMVKIAASAAALLPDTLTLRIKDRFVLDDFESYPSDNALRSGWSVRAGTSVTFSLNREDKREGGQAMRAAYGIGTGLGFRPNASFEKAVNQDITGAEVLSFWLKGDGSGREIMIRLTDSNRKYMQYAFALSESEYVRMLIPLSDFVTRKPDWELDYSQITSIRFTLEKGSGENGEGVLLMDDLKCLKNMPSEVQETGGIIRRFQLCPNYPNPFNPSTRIQFYLPKSEITEVTIFNLLGEKVETLMTQRLPAGAHELVWNAERHSSGLYFVQLKAGDFSAARKICFQK